MSNIDDKIKEDNKKIIYLNNKIFEERMKKYSEKISKSEYEYFEGRVRNIKDYQNQKSKNIEIEEVDTKKEIDRIKEVIEEKGKTSSYNNEIAFKLKKLKIKMLKITTILAILYVSPFLINNLTDSGVNIFVSLGVVITLIYVSIMFISTI